MENEPPIRPVRTFNTETELLEYVKEQTLLFILRNGMLSRETIINSMMTILICEKDWIEEGLDELVKEKRLFLKYSFNP